MYRSIVVPLDGSPFSEYAVPFAAAIARRSGAILRLLHVHTPIEGAPIDGFPRINAHLDRESREHERSYLERVRQELARDAGQPATVALLDGSVAEALADEISVSDADLVVMTTHGRGGWTRMWLGSVADKLIHHVPIPLLLIRPRQVTAPQPEFHTILIPLDGSPLAEQIIDQLQDLDLDQDAEYTLLRVVHPFVSLGYHGATPVPDVDYNMTLYRQHDAQDYLETVAHRMRLSGRKVQTRVVIEEQAAAVILQQAREIGVELIALATHGRGGASRLLIGSVADKVMRGAECPVFVFRPTPVEKGSVTNGSTMAQHSIRVI